MELSVQRCSAVTKIPRVPSVAALSAGCRSVKLPAFAAAPSRLAFPCSALNFPSAAVLLRRRHFIRASKSVDSGGADPRILNKVVHLSAVFWRFLRPYTIRGTIIGSLSLFTRALMENQIPITWPLLLTALSGLVALICANGYIAGVNQIYDVAIDKVNKPYLPIAARDMSEGTAWVLVSSMAAVGFAIVAWVNSSGPFLTSLYCLSLFFGFIYSAPPFRLKRFPVVTLLMISTVRGFMLNYGIYYAMRATLGLTFEWSFPVAFITSFITLFALVIGITKDLPDVEGDREFKIDTFASKHGVRNIALFSSGLVLMNYIGAIALAVFLPQVFKKSFMIPRRYFPGFGPWKRQTIRRKRSLVSTNSYGFYTTPSMQCFPSSSKKIKLQLRERRASINRLVEKLWNMLWFKIDTFASKLGVRNIAWLSSGLLLMSYIGAVLLAIFLPQVFNKSLMIASHVILALGLLIRVLWLEKENYTKESLTSFYRFIWILFYSEYALFPFI